MSTQTSKLQLVKQANNENWSNEIHNANLQKIDDFAATVDPTNAAWVNNTDINTLTSTGIYPIGSGNTNAGGSWGIMLVLAPRSDTIEQIHYGYGSMSVREYRASTGWTQWFSFAKQ